MIQIEKPAPPSIVAELAPLVKAAQAFEVKDVESHGGALERIKALRAGEKGIENHFAKAKKDASDAHKSIVAAVAGLIGPIAAARTIYDRSAQEYERIERQKAEEEQRRLQEQARKQEEERQLLDAIDAEAGGNLQEAEAILAQPVSVPTVRVAPAVAQVKGVSTRELWWAEIHDVAACLKWMLEREEWAPAIGRCKDILETVLRPLAVAQRDAMSIPGVRAVSKQSRSTRS